MLLLLQILFLHSRHSKFSVLSIKLCSITSISFAERRSPLTPARGRGFDCGLKVELAWRIELVAGQVLRATPCSPIFENANTSKPD